MGNTKSAVFSRKFSKTRWAIAAATILIAATFLIPADFNIVADGVLLPTNRQRIYAELDGVVVDVGIDHGSNVHKGEIVARLVNQDLLFQLEQIKGEIAGLRQRLDATQASRIRRRADAQEAQDDQNNTKNILTQIEGLEKLKTALELKIKKLDIKSPLAGQVITWNARDQLLNRPVQPGEVLLEIADTQGDWEMLIHVPSKKIGHVMRAHDELGKLTVTYAIASDPGTWREGEVIEIDRATRLQADNSQTVTLRVRIPMTASAYPANTGTTAKIHCGRHSLGYVWIHDTVEFVRENVIFRIF